MQLHLHKENFNVAEELLALGARRTTVIVVRKFNNHVHKQNHKTAFNITSRIKVIIRLTGFA
jgi:hypothetical protein